MKILKTTVMLIDLDALGHHLDVDTIEYKGQLWLVPEWADTVDGKWTKPTRLICLSKLPFEKNKPGVSAEYSLMCPMTKAILGGEVPKETNLQYEIVEDPPIEIPRGEGNTLH